MATQDKIDAFRASLAETPLTLACRKALPRFAGRNLVLARTIPAEIRRVLDDRDLLEEHANSGYLLASPRCQGYIADPSTFTA